MCLFSLLGTYVCGTAVHDTYVNNVSLTMPLSPLFYPFVLDDVLLSHLSYRVLSDSALSAPKSLSQYRVFVPANVSVMYHVVRTQGTARLVRTYGVTDPGYKTNLRKSSEPPDPPSKAHIRIL
jgi:hypothetical protein